MQPILSTGSYVGPQHITTPCQCVTCSNKMQAVLHTIAIIIDDELIDFKRPSDFKCSNCHSSYIRWGELKIVQ